MRKAVSLYNEMNEQGVKFFHWAIDEAKAVTMEMNNKYYVFVDFASIATTADETCIIAHECGHVATGATHKLYSKCDLIERHEACANKWAIKKLAPLGELIEAIKNGINEIWDLADYFEVTEDFMRQAIEYYTVNKNINLNKYKDD